ncbi:nitroreductase [Litorivivens lipolytica]|uniref:Putative NAD(P)H nitroreductase n=1 Tax=Litorivivens lipolytica TaxID=1524264 RepID=A0A7W4W3C2_9GAMM|nr:nitroreductase [Litorivivens lipolytica]MBB3046676.1 nitroreductase [Litorivivens lipolytica]
MDALQLLLERNSAPKLTEPGPTPAELKTLLDAAVRAPDHARLRPWRFLLIEGEARHALGEVFARAAARRNPDTTDADLDKARSKALRAPLIIAVVVCYTEHPKVPLLEQQLSAGCAAHSILLAAETMGYAGIWRTGANAFDREVLAELNLAEHESLVGYLYIGSRDGRPKPLPGYDSQTFASTWPSE